MKSQPDTILYGGVELERGWNKKSTLSDLDKFRYTDNRHILPSWTTIKAVYHSKIIMTATSSWMCLRKLQGSTLCFVAFLLLGSCTCYLDDVHGWGWVGCQRGLHGLGGMLMFMYMLRWSCYVDDVQGWVGWDVNVHPQVSCLCSGVGCGGVLTLKYMLRWPCSGDDVQGGGWEVGNSQKFAAMSKLFHG